MTAKQLIAMQRIVARRLVECIEQAQGPVEVANLGKALATVVNSLGRLVRVHNMIAGPQSEAETTFLEALEAVHRELNIDNCNPLPRMITYPENKVERQSSTCNLQPASCNRLPIRSS